MSNLSKLRIVSVGELKQATNGRHYFTIGVRHGLSKTVTRVMWSKSESLEQGFERISRNEALELLESEVNLAEFASIQTVPCKPREWESDNGLVRVSERTMVIFADESEAKALKSYGEKPREEVETTEARESLSVE